MIQLYQRIYRYIEYTYIGIYRINMPKYIYLHIYPEKTMVWRDTCTPTFIAILFTIAKTWKQPVFINRWMDKDVTYTMERYSAIKKNGIMPATQMDLETITLSEQSQTEKDKHHVILLVWRI